MQTASKQQLEADLDMANSVKMASQLLTHSDNARRVFNAIEEGHGKLSGWRIAKNVDLSTDEVLVIVSQLKEYGVVEGTDAGLDGYYYLTKLGFGLRNGYSLAV